MYLSNAEIFRRDSIGCRGPVMIQCDPPHTHPCEDEASLTAESFKSSIESNWKYEPKSPIVLGSSDQFFSRHKVLYCLSEDLKANSVVKPNI